VQHCDFAEAYAVTALRVDQVDETLSTMSQLARPGNYLGICALAMPCGFDAAGMPISLQIIGRPNEDALILRIGQAYEQAAPQRRRPDLEAFVGRD
jgi:aspartyl-tRNA(Asn)/glutamyl-tRNA(Gln) amidotransferase subunit A